MPRFAILEHDHPTLHWDLMLESEGKLRTWRLQTPLDKSGVIDAHELGDHRIAYLDYEGPVSGGRGNVLRWDAGIYTVNLWHAGEVRAILAGAKVRGVLCLRKVGSCWTCGYQAEASAATT
jgi:hypothetical protein